MNPPSASSWAAWAFRAALAAVAALLGLAALSGYRELRSARAGAFAWLDHTGVTLDAAALGREPEPERVRLRAARAILAAELDPAHHPGREAGESAGRMAEAARAGREILARRPASWEAALVTGAATYLGWSQAQDPRLFTAYREWEAPLEAALRLAPSKREPARFLAAAYLEIWPALSPRKRGIARGLLAGVMRDPEDLARLIDPWLDTATGREEAFSVLPDDPAAWERVEGAYARRRDLAGFTAARRRREDSLIGQLRRDLLEADRLRGDGRIEGARGLYLSVAGRARPEARYLDIFEQAVERCPPGPVDSRTAERLEPHLARALDRCLFAECDLEPAALKRLSRFVREPSPPQAALASLFAGDLPRAVLYERRSEGLGTEPWIPYLIAKARALAARGRVDEAREALSLVHMDGRRRPLYWRARAEVARAAADPIALAEAEARLGDFSRRRWEAVDWTWRKGTARLEVVTAEPARGLAMVFDSLPADGSLVELRIDGTAVGAFPVRPSTGSSALLALAAPVGRGLHVLEVEALDGNRPLPGAVELR